MQIRDRIKELRRVKASDLIPNPKNWRTHPVEQQDALRGVLAEVGYADALIARETPEGLVLVDGHLRAETTPDSEVPVLVLDINEAEADLMLATLDPLAAMADADMERLGALLEGLDKNNENLSVLLEDISDKYNVSLKELLEQDTDAAYKAPDDWLVDRDDDPEFRTLKAMVLHFSQDDYDEWMEACYKLGEKWDIENLSGVALEAVRRASNGVS